MRQADLQRHLIANTTATDAEAPVKIEELPNLNEVTVKIEIPAGKAWLGLGEGTSAHRRPPEERRQTDPERCDSTRSPESFRR